MADTATPNGATLERHDAIVIGAGISGLVAASDLAQRGHRVLVLEHDHQAGGLMAGIRRKGFYFDAGCQSFEDMGIVFPLLEQYGLSDVARFRRARYRVVMPRVDLVVESLPQVSRAFQAAYPESADAFARVFALHERTSQLVGRLFVKGRVPFVADGGPDSMARWALGAFEGAGSPLAWARQLADLRTLLLGDAGEWYERQLPPSGARDLLARCGYTHMNVFVASAFWHLWAHDYWYPEGGLQGWWDRWVARLQERGVRFLFKRTVTSLERQGRRITGVLTHKGERFEADQVVYTGDLRQAVHRLVGAELFPRSFVERLDVTRHSDALVSAYVGLDVPADELRERLRASHVFYFPRSDCQTAMDPADADAHRKAWLEVTAHGIDDPTLAPPGQSALVVQAFTRHDWLGGWRTGLAGDPAREGRPPPRPGAYRQLKRDVGGQLVATLEGLIPGAASRVVFCDVGAPPSTVRFTRNAFGGSCGFELNWRNFPFRQPLGHVDAPLSNLHLAGHFTVWPGAVPTAALSGRLAALRAHDSLRAKARGARTVRTARPARSGGNDVGVTPR